MYPTGHYPQPPYGYPPPSTQYYGPQHQAQHQHWPQAQQPPYQHSHPQPYQQHQHQYQPPPQPQPQPPPTPQPAAQAKNRFPSSKQWRRDERGGGKSQFFYSEAPENKRQKLDNPSQGSPVSHGSPISPAPEAASGPAPPPQYHPQQFAPPPIAHTPTPTPPAGWNHHHPPHAWHGAPSAGPHFASPPQGYQPPNAYHQGYHPHQHPPQAHPGYPPQAAYPPGHGYPQPPYAVPYQPNPFQPQLHHHYAAHQQQTPPPHGHWIGPPQEGFQGGRGRNHGFSKSPFNRQQSGQPGTNPWKPRPSGGIHNYQKSAFHRPPPPQSTPPRPASVHGTPNKTPNASQEFDDNSWIDCEPDEYWPKEEELVTELGLGFVVWRPPQSVPKVIPSTLKAYEEWSEHRNRYNRRKNGDSVSKYLWESRLEEHCLPIAVTDEWKEVKDDPIFVEFHKESRMIPLEEVIGARAKPEVQVEGDLRSDGPETSDTPHDHATPVSTDSSVKQQSPAQAGTKRSASEALDDEDPYSPPPAESHTHQIQEFEQATVQDNESVSQESDEIHDMPQELDARPITPSTFAHDLPKKPNGPMSQPVNDPSAERKYSENRQQPHNAGAPEIMRDQAQEDILARLGVTGSPKPALSKIGPAYSKSAPNHVEKKVSPTSSIPKYPSRKGSHHRTAEDHVPPPPPPPPPQQKAPPSNLCDSRVAPDLSDPWSQDLDHGIPQDSPRSETSHHTMAGSDFEEDTTTTPERRDSTLATGEDQRESRKQSSETSPSENNDEHKLYGSVRKRPREHSTEPEIRRQEDDTLGRHRKKGPKVNAVYDRRW